MRAFPFMFMGIRIGTEKKKDWAAMWVTVLDIATNV